MEQNERIAAGQILEQRYEVQELLGQGGFAAVYRAWDLHLQRACAIKENRLATPEAQRQFEREAKMLAGLHHPNLPRVTDHFVIPERGQYLVMDYVAGDDLHQRVFGQTGRIDPAQALAWILPICDALTYLHSQTLPIIHRDVKPQNIILAANDQPYLVDFGIAKTYRPDLATATGARAISPGYSSPEQYGQAATDERSDQYSLGATLYTLLTRIIPPDSVDVMSGSLAAPLPVRQCNPGVAPHISDAIQRAMDPARARRFDSVAAFKQALLTPHPAASLKRSSGKITVAMVPSGRPAPRKGGSAPSGPETVARPTSQPPKRAPKVEKLRGLLSAAPADAGHPAPPLAHAQAMPAPEPASNQSAALMAPPLSGFNWGLPVIGVIAALGVVGILALIWLIGQAGRPAQRPGSPTPENQGGLPVAHTQTAAALAVSTPSATPTPVPSSTPTVTPSPIPPGQDDTPMTLIPSGAFIMGLTDEMAQWHLSLCNQFSSCNLIDYRDAMPAHRVSLSAFQIDSHEVTNRQYRTCVQVGVCQAASQSIFVDPLPGDYASSPAYDDYPAVGMTWDDAVAYCQWVGKRLPSEAEWERAASGEGAWVFPWGNPSSEEPLNIGLIFGGRGPLANYCDQRCTSAWRDPENDDGWVGPAPVMSYLPNFMGLYDLSGNVQEWVFDFYSPDFYSRSPQDNPVNQTPAACPERSELDCHLARGGGWNNGLYHATARFRYYAYAGSARTSRGFRCALTP